MDLVILRLARIRWQRWIGVAQICDLMTLSLLYGFLSLSLPGVQRDSSLIIPVFLCVLLMFIRVIGGVYQVLQERHSSRVVNYSCLRAFWVHFFITPMIYFLLELSGLELPGALFIVSFLFLSFFACSTVQSLLSDNGDHTSKARS